MSKPESWGQVWLAFQPFFLSALVTMLWFFSCAYSGNLRVVAVLCGSIYANIESRLIITIMSTKIPNSHHYRAGFMKWMYCQNDFFCLDWNGFLLESIDNGFDFRICIRRSRTNGRVRGRSRTMKQGGLSSVTLFGFKHVLRLESDPLTRERLDYEILKSRILKIIWKLWWIDRRKTFSVGSNCYLLIA